MLKAKTTLHEQHVLERKPEVLTHSATWRCGSVRELCGLTQDLLGQVVGFVESLPQIRRQGRGRPQGASETAQVRQRQWVACSTGRKRACDGAGPCRARRRVQGKGQAVRAALQGHFVGVHLVFDSSKLGARDLQAAAAGRSSLLGSRGVVHGDFLPGVEVLAALSDANQLTLLQDPLELHLASALGPGEGLRKSLEPLPSSAATCH